MDSIDALGKMAAETAMKAFADFVRRNGLTVTDFQGAIDCIRRIIHERIDQAMADAKAALDCGMSQVADATFRASMIQCGIDAAKEFTAV